MSLRKKTLFSIGITTLGLLLILYFSSRFILLSSYENLEAQGVNESVKRVLNSLEDDLRKLQSLNTNYSAWDDTYAFMKTTHSPDDVLSHPYIMSNYGASTFTLNNINLIMLIDASGKVVFSKAYDLREYEEAPVPDDIYQHIRSNKTFLLTHASSVGHKTGLLSLKQGTMLISSLPIVTGDLRGPIRGTVLMGRYLTQDVIKNLSDKTRIHVKLTPFTSVDLPKNLELNAMTSIKDSPIWIAPKNGETVTGSAILNDIYGKPTLKLTIDRPRLIYQRGQDSLIYLLAVLVAASLIFGVIVIFILEKSLLSRLTLLMRGVTQIRQNRDFSARIPVTGTDEISQLERKFNSMMDALEESQEKIKHQAYHDTLTILPNRYLFFDSLHRSIQRLDGTGQKLAVLFLDLDNFKSVNESLGHDIGDMLLKEVANRLKSVMRPGDSLSRMGGDEFTMMLSPITDEAEVEAYIKLIENVLSKPFILMDHQLFFSTSVGVSLYPDHGKTAEILVKNADIAMLRVKREGKNGSRFYSEDMKDTISRKHLLEQYLRKALEFDEFLLYYQPKVNIRTGQIVGMEALLRWEHPILGLVPPSEFIPVAEETGFILSVGEWVLRTACVQNKKWQHAGFPHLQVAVNLSSTQFQDPDLVQKINNILKETELEPEYLELEITESIAIQNSDSVNYKLNLLKKMGIKISIDDFGTGYSSLSYLKRFPIDTLKIDKSFIDDITENVSIPRAIIAMAQSLQLHVTAEGVETQEQLGILGELGCDDMQGYLFSRPLGTHDFEQLLTRQHQSVKEA
ncbi:bifunctional diguanylate cyclase/phosphodiesterase [Brevibacillus dissolubilis]|uniref:bifunctional diguanylate cyclase/phosphodiesterase n=1 Tax=Brevibacillus dissolubilis TaxID=1844116 RepID=UPI001116B80F|nr:EAL domain-containing protein [Brevibacillus dissolubilis]